MALSNLSSPSTRPAPVPHSDSEVHGGGSNAALAFVAFSPLRLPVAKPWLAHLSGVGWGQLQGGLQEMHPANVLAFPVYRGSAGARGARESWAPRAGPPKSRAPQSGTFENPRPL